MLTVYAVQNGRGVTYENVDSVQYENGKFILKCYKNGKREDHAFWSTIGFRIEIYTSEAWKHMCDIANEIAKETK